LFPVERLTTYERAKHPSVPYKKISNATGTCDK